MGSPNLRDGREGSAAVEFALVGPILVVLLAALVVYGGWFWMAQSVQTMASEGARAAVGGLDHAERERLARSFIATEAQAGAGLDPSRAVIAVESDLEAIRVRVAYDVSGEPVMALAGLLPAPPTVIERTAVVRIGGYG